ncbi:hypothetical protein MBAV_001895 [Candidatus Magnetobacterium bavaricum]|uniref:Uncharacterized protein n=1 Tax=Candidatus Magnetobacterium bavaricum TaxID=29290 RepID=A0A0F3GVI8_9BACT|nr:hypothetical protein MBAV_001895 [Candidatus Magnetobacterium bavaricum]
MVKHSGILVDLSKMLLIPFGGGLREGLPGGFDDIINDFQVFRGCFLCGFIFNYSMGLYLPRF